MAECHTMNNPVSIVYCIELSFLFTSKPFLERNSLSYLQRNKKCTRHNRCNKILETTLLENLTDDAIA